MPQLGRQQTTLRRIPMRIVGLNLLIRLVIEHTCSPDHLVIHPFGLLIVESKSVTGSVQIKDDGQWIRWFNKQATGMRSPITQAQMQLMLLKELLGASVKQKGFFDAVRFDVLVAISDSGTIQWPTTGALPEVCKADQVHERIIQRIDANQRLRKQDEVLREGHRAAIGEFLLKAHKPLTRDVVVASKEDSQQANFAAASVPSTNSEREPKTDGLATLGLSSKACKHCENAELEVRYGQYGYYFFCKSCGKNTRIKFPCPKCTGEGRIRKQGNQYFAECKTCDASALYHSN